MKKVLVIGAQNIDIFAQTKSDYILHDSNPAKITMAFGGVGRNIAENLCRLGNEVHFISVFADDHLSISALGSLEKMGINTSNSLFLANQSNSVYLGILNPDNDLFLGLHDMAILEELNRDFLQSKTSFISEFDMIVIDNNLSSDALDYLLNSFSEKTIVMDAVSAIKAVKLIPYLDKISILKLNQIELNALSLANDKSSQIEELHKKGAKILLITHQERDVIMSKQEGKIDKKPLKMETMVNATGAGDAFLSGFVHGILHGLNDNDKLNYANIVAHITLKSNHSTSEFLNINEVEKYINHE